jgi:hypothetical protein
LSTRLTARLRTIAAPPQPLFAIVDEGPGLSGSSFASVVEQLTSLGVPDHRIVLFPSWRANARNLSSARARHLWRRHLQFVGDFEAAWLRSGRLAEAFDAPILQDLSAGQWRSLVFGPSSAIPAVQPQHECRKLLARRTGGERMLIKFLGLDRGGASRRDKAARVAEAGYGPSVDRFAQGFLATRWVEGSPVAPSDITPDVVRRVARYLAWTFRSERTGRDANPAPLLEMLRVNVAEGLGADWESGFGNCWRDSSEAVARAPAVRVDGRMLPHEWLRTSDGIIKTDAASHFDDHFYPGETDIAWDLAGAAIELELAPAAERMLIREFQLAAGHIDVDCRLPFMRAAYLAFRLGYTTMAATALGASDDAKRMRTAADRYGQLLQRELSAYRVNGQSCATGT